jgi:hypothetical protein
MPYPEPPPFARSTLGAGSARIADMKRSTAVGHLVETAEVSSEQLRFRGTEIGWPVEELWVSGDLLGLADTVEVGSVVLALDVPPDEAPWLAINPAGEWAGELLRLGKRPLLWSYRPLAWPVWNYRHRRLARYWSAGEGLDDTVIDALRTRRLDRLDVVEPTAAELARQLQAELPVSRTHLRSTLERYWDRDWRREHKGYDESPEDHLWRAAAAVSEMQDAIDELGT